MKQDKKLWELNKKANKMDKKSFPLNSEFYGLDNDCFKLDRTYNYWGSYLSSEQYLKYIKNKKGE